MNEGNRHDAVIDVHGLNKSFGNKHVVVDLSMRVDAKARSSASSGRTAAARRRRFA